MCVVSPSCAVAMMTVSPQVHAAASWARKDAILSSFASINSSFSSICSHLIVQNRLALAVWVRTSALNHSTSSGDTADRLASNSAISDLSLSHLMQPLFSSSHLSWREPNGVSCFWGAPHTVHCITTRQTCVMCQLQCSFIVHHMCNCVIVLYMATWPLLLRLRACLNNSLVIH